MTKMRNILKRIWPTYELYTPEPRVPGLFEAIKDLVVESRKQDIFPITVTITISLRLITDSYPFPLSPLRTRILVLWSRGTLFDAPVSFQNLFLRRGPYPNISSRFLTHLSNRSLGSVVDRRVLYSEWAKGNGTGSVHWIYWLSILIQGSDTITLQEINTAWTLDPRWNVLNSSHSCGSNMYANRAVAS